MGLEIKAFEAKDLDLKPTGEVKVAFAQIGAVDTDGDYTFPGAIPVKDVPISAYNHATWPQKGGLLPTGRGSLKEDGNWGILEGRFFLKTTHGADAYETVKEMGDLQQWSYGYNVLEKAKPPEGVKALRGLKSLDIREVSPVFLGAQPTTHTMDLKELNDSLDEFDEIMASLKEGSLAGLTYAEMSSRVQRGFEAFVDRTGDIIDLRTKEGRALSTDRTALLMEAIGNVTDYLGRLRKMVEDAQPKPKPGEGDEAPPKTADLAMEAKRRYIALRLEDLTTGVNA